MLYTKERLKEMSASIDHSFLYYILEEQEKQTKLLEQLAGKSEPEQAKNKGGRPRKEQVDADIVS